MTSLPRFAAMAAWCLVLGCAGGPDADDPCTSDSECPGEFACGDPASNRTDAKGCVERCSVETDCKAGTVCASDGECAEEAEVIDPTGTDAS